MTSRYRSHYITRTKVIHDKLLLSKKWDPQHVKLTHVRTGIARHSIIIYSYPKGIKPHTVVFVYRLYMNFVTDRIIYRELYADIF